LGWAGLSACVSSGVCNYSQEHTHTHSAHCSLQRVDCCVPMTMTACAPSRRKQSRPTLCQCDRFVWKRRESSQWKEVLKIQDWTMTECDLPKPALSSMTSVGAAGGSSTSSALKVTAWTNTSTRSQSNIQEDSDNRDEQQRHDDSMTTPVAVAATSADHAISAS